MKYRRIFPNRLHFSLLVFPLIIPVIKFSRVTQKHSLQFMDVFWYCVVHSQEVDTLVNKYVQPSSPATNGQ